MYTFKAEYFNSKTEEVSNTVNGNIYTNDLYYSKDKKDGFAAVDGGLEVEYLGDLIGEMPKTKQGEECYFQVFDKDNNLVYATYPMI